MKERPILFSGPMVRALLDGSKTQTRRIGKTQCAVWTELSVEYSRHAKKGKVAVATHLAYPNGTARHGICECPYGIPGDRLWVREAFRFPESLDHLSPAQVGHKAISAGYPQPWCPTQFEADSSRRTPQEWRDFVTPPQANDAGRLRVGMHMPRWASRITLEVTRVRVERLQDISEADAMAEGSPPSHPSIDRISREFGYADFPRSWYAQLWEQINGPGSWAANPWVWAIEFRRLP